MVRLFIFSHWLLDSVSSVGVVMRIKWKRSEEGYVESHDGRFSIVPLFCGTTQPQYYDCYDERVPKSRIKVASLCDTQRECKAEAESYLQRG